MSTGVLDETGWGAGVPTPWQVPKPGTNRDPSEKQFQVLYLLLWLLLSCCSFTIGIFLGNLWLVFCLSLLQEKPREPEEN